MNTNEKDWLEQLFQRLPKEELVASFREDMMKRITAEAVRIKKRNEQLGWLSVVLASLTIIGLAVAAIIRVSGTPQWNFPKLHINMEAIPFYLYIGALALILLVVDHFASRAYKKKHQSIDKTP